MRDDGNTLHSVQKSPKKFQKLTKVQKSDFFRQIATFQKNFHEKIVQLKVRFFSQIEVR